MKTYADHLTSTKSFGEAIDPRKKPVVRSSAVFPCVVNESMGTDILFMGYWLLKRNMKEISLLATLRSEGGEVINRNFRVINEVRAYRISVQDLLEEIGREDDFRGSIEIEVFSTQDMVFPYPAFVVCFNSEESATFVHTCGRIYNDFEDLKEASAIAVPETGFDLSPDPGFHPYISFVNGPFAIDEQSVDVEIINTNGETRTKSLPLGSIAPYETKFLFLMDGEEKDFLGGEKGTAKIRHDLQGFFPRFVAGNFDAGWSNTSITHSYYDTQHQTDEAAYWTNPDPAILADSVVVFPLFAEDGAYTQLAIYPIFAPSDIACDLDLFAPDGTHLARIPECAEIKGDAQRLRYLDIAKMLNEIGFKAESNSYVRITLRGEGRLPARLKFGLNLGNPAKHDIPSNICFAAKVPNIKLLDKPGTFKWAPIVNRGGSMLVLSNISPVLEGFREANVNLKIWRESDDTPLERSIQIADNGSHWFDIRKDAEAADFLEGRTGWVTAQSDNPFVDGYYIEDRGHGIIGADHIF